MKRIAYGVLAFFVSTSCALGQIPNRASLGDSGPQMSSSGNDLGAKPWFMTTGATTGNSALPATGTTGGAAIAPVSITELRIPAAAMKELLVFQEKFAAGKMAEAAKHVEKAIRIYPQLAAAHHNLGLCYAQLGEYDQAAAEFQSAAELDGRLVQPRVSLAEVYYLQKKYREGEAAARSALDLDPVNKLARYFLGTNMALGGRDTQEAIDLLRESSEEFPFAHLALSDVLLRRNEVDAAVQEMREYLRRPDAPAKEKVACKLEKITKADASKKCATT